MRWFMLRKISILALVMSVGPALLSATVRGQDIFVTTASNTIGEYTTSGGTVNASLVPGMSRATGVVVSGSDLFITNSPTTIGEYTMSGAVVNASLLSSGFYYGDWFALAGPDFLVSSWSYNWISEYTASGTPVSVPLVSGLRGPGGIVVSGSNLFVADSGNNRVGEYTTSGATVNPSLIAGLSGPAGLVLSGSDLFVTTVGNGQNGNGTIGEYTTSGAVVNASLVSGLNYPLGLALSGSDLFVVNANTGTIGEYTTSGATVNASLVTGLNGPYGIAITPGPVNGTWANGAGGNWSASGNWSGGNAPGVNGPSQSANDTATFGVAATSGTSVTVTLDTSPQLSAMTFSSTSSYVLQGGGTNFLTLSAPTARRWSR